MARDRLMLDELLVDVLGSENVYFSPPSGAEMHYPCITYDLSGDKPTYADNIKYLNAKRYVVSVIDEDPDSKIADDILELPYCSFDRKFEVDNLNHFVFDLYF